MLSPFWERDFLFKEQLWLNRHQQSRQYGCTDSIEEDVLVGFRKEQMQMIREHFNVVTYKQFKESGISNPSIVGMHIFVCLVYFFKKPRIFAGLIIGKCKGAPGMHPLSSNFFHFHAVFGKNCPK